MIDKKEGIINEIIYDNTVYNNAQYRLYPTIIELKRIIKEIIDSESTTSYLRFTPFYLNSKGSLQIEFEDYMFYFECREQVDDNDISEHIASCMEIEADEMDNEQKRIANILYPLCCHDDVNHYRINLENYLDYLDELIPQLMNIVRDKTKISNDEISFGYFCFEVHSG